MWFFWHEIAGVLSPGKTATRPGAGSTHDREAGRDGQPVKRSRENIPDEDRKKLDEILQRR
jgi:hypothetical protein